MTIYPILDDDKIEISGSEYRQLLDDLDSVFRVVSGQIRQAENQIKSLEFSLRRIEKISLLISENINIGEN